jgi:hypothetical protein
MLDQITLDYRTPRVLRLGPKTTSALIIDRIVIVGRLRRNQLWTGAHDPGGLIPKTEVPQLRDDLAGIAASHAFQQRSNIAITDQK